jgi:hypothetical protein
MKKVYILVLLALLSGYATTKIISNPNNILVGNWVGEREHISGCQYYSWATKRNVDGTYKITFYKDSNRTIKVHSESGNWWVSKSVFYEKANDLMKEPDGYNYKIISSDLISFKMLSADETADCKGDYSFKDMRVKENSNK